MMEGLRILPDDDRLGPVDEDAGSPVRPPSPPPERRDLYGPRPRVYGPVIQRPGSTSTATTAPVYGPKIVRNDALDLGGLP